MAAAILNSLLAALPRKSYRRLLPGLAPVDLAFGEVLYDAGEPIRDVYFPSQSLVSLLTLVEGHLALEVGMVGRADPGRPRPRSGLLQLLPGRQGHARPDLEWQKRMREIPE
jgi:hypothetical protein